MKTVTRKTKKSIRARIATPAAQGFQRRDHRDSKIRRPTGKRIGLNCDAYQAKYRVISTGNGVSGS